ncbi:MAG: translocation/assembly module TamB domain-containing protein [Proteobacteria bacterium]|nr:translocation/assembly module TamB domain-containing protein [Pseudomonadota bacterium]
MTIRKTHKFRRLIGLMALLSGFAGACAWLANRPETLAHALAVVNAGGRVEIQAGSFKWSPVQGEISLDSVSFLDKKSGKRAFAGSVRIDYAMLGLVRGKLVVDELTIRDLRIEIPGPAGPAAGGPHKRLDTARLMLLRHIEVLDAGAFGVTVSIADKAEMVIDELHASLVPSMLGDARLAVRADGVVLGRDDRRLVAAGSASLKTSTRLSRWSNEFPYVNSFSGQLNVRDLSTSHISAEEIEAGLTFEDGKIEAGDFSIQIQGRRLAGRLAADTSDESFDLEIRMPSPISIPSFGIEPRVFETAGGLSGAIGLKGTGFSPLKSKGSGFASLTHRFAAAPDHPASLDCAFDWSGGRITISAGRARVAANDIALGGSVDVAGKSMDLTASGSRFPVERVFENFGNEHLKKIFGATDFEARAGGWGKGFRIGIKGTTTDGGWKPIFADRVETELDITYDELSMRNAIFSGQRRTGTSDLTVRFGAKMADGHRRKDIDFEASAADMPLERPMRELGLSGTADGTVEIRGPHTDFRGVAVITARDGAWRSIPFEHASVRLGISRERIDFSDMEVALQGSPRSKLAGGLVADLLPGRMRLHGEPIQGLSVDSAYAYDSKTWTFTEMSWTGPGEERLVARGRFVSDGPMDISVAGSLDAATLSKLTPSLYRGEGPIDVDLSARGSGSDPRFHGTVTFRKNSVLLRSPRLELQELSGSVRLEGQRVRLDGISAKMDEGSMKLSGWLDHQGFRPAQSDLTLTAKGMTWRSEDGYLMLEFEGALSLAGRFPNPTLSGEVVIQDGRYTKDFMIFEAMAGGGKAPEPARAEALDFDPRLSLSVRNSGDMEIRNNVGDIWLNVNMALSGTRSRPAFAGSINATGGSVHYLGLKFDITRGFVEFRGDLRSPYIEVYAEKEIDAYNVSLVLHGPVDNLALDLSATSPSGPLEKRDVVSLILFGMTEQERIATQREGLSSAMIAQSITSVIERPVQKFTRLDVFRLEAADAGSIGVQRLNVGKRLSDRLTVGFSTDIGTDNAVQTFSAEYQITDNLLIKGSQSTDSTYDLSGILRFRLR